MMRSLRGFTLIELIVVLGLLSIATSLAVGTFFRMNDTWDTVRTGAEFDKRAEDIFDDFRRDTETALSAQVASVPIVHNERTSSAQYQEFFSVAFADDTITLPVFAEVGSDRNLTAAKVRYHIDRGNRSSVLRREITSIGGEFDPENPGITIDDGVIGLDIQFPAANGHGWTPTWGRPGTPPLLRVSILMIDPDNPTEQAARTAVFRIHD